MINNLALNEPRKVQSVRNLVYEPIEGFQVVDELSDTIRNNGGFGSTGKA